MCCVLIISLCRTLEAENCLLGQLALAFSESCMVTFEDLSSWYKPKNFYNITHHALNAANMCAASSHNPSIAAQKPGDLDSHSMPGFCREPQNDLKAERTSWLQESLPPLLSGDVLAQAVSQVDLSMDGWEKEAHIDIFKLFVVLVEPPVDLDLGTIPGLPDYLDALYHQGLKIEHNHLHGIASHCFRALHGI